MKALEKTRTTFASFGDRHPVWAIALKAIVLGLPPAAVAYANYSGKVELYFQPELLGFFSKHPVVFTSFLAWPLFGTAIISTFEHLARKLRRLWTLESEHLVAFITACDDIVGKKLNRFGDYAKGLAKTAKPHNTFLDITQPRQQMEHITMSFWHLLRLTTRDASLKVVLVQITDGLPRQIICRHPNDAVVPEDLCGQQAKNTLFAQAARTKKLAIIEDIEAHVKKPPPRKGRIRKSYAPIGISGEDCGSILCFPIVSEQLNRVLFVLSIKSDQVRAIDARFDKKYGTLLKSFGNRLLLEAHLFVIREEVGRES